MLRESEGEVFVFYLICQCLSAVARVVLMRFYFRSFLFGLYEDARYVVKSLYDAVV